MKHRKLRVAWSVTWGVMAVLLCLLWVRSYWRTDRITCLESFVGSHIESSVGYASFIRFHYDLALLGADYDWSFSSSPVEVNDDEAQPAFTFEFEDGIWVSVPFVLPVSLLAAIAATPWLPLKRFSLRSLLIAMTFVALGMGLIIYATRG